MPAPSSQRRSGTSQRPAAASSGSSAAGGRILPGGSRSGAAIPAIGGLAVVLLVAVGLIMHHAADIPPRGAAPMPSWPGDGTAALLNAASDRLSGKTKDPADAAALAREAILTSPLNPMALIALANAEAAKGDAGAADALYRLAADRYKHLPDLQLWAIGDAQKNKDYPGIIGHIDTYLRKTADVALPNFVLSQKAADIIKNLVALSGDPAAAPIIKQYVDMHPNWRDLYLTELAKSGPPGSFEAVVGDIDYKEIVPQWRSYLYRLIDSGRAADAYALWYQLMEARHLTDDDGSYIFDRGFELGDSDNLPFSWTIFQAPSTSIDYDHSMSSDGATSLRVIFSAPVQFANVFQSLLLNPGTYTFSGAVKMSYLEAGRGVQWRLYCGRTGPTIIGESPLFSGNADWQRFSVPFTVPPDKCDNQLLRLEVPARIPAERAIKGRIWFDDLSISRNAGE